MINKRTIILIFLVSIILSQKVFMQENSELITDRPDITESAIVVPQNTFQIETGFMFQKQKFVEHSTDYENENLILASTLCRYGINDIIELRFGGEYFLGKTTAGIKKTIIQGLQGIFVGSKIQLAKEGNIVNNIAVILEAALPFGNEKLRPDKFEPGIIFAFDKPISETINLGMNFGSSKIKSINDFILDYSVSIGFSLDDRWTAFAEYFGNTAKKAQPEHNIHFGFTYLQKENIQIDISSGSLIFNDETDYFGQVGFSIRLPR